MARSRTDLPFTGPFTYNDVVARGLGQADVRRWLASGSAVRLARGVYSPALSEPAPPGGHVQTRHAVHSGAVPVPTLMAARIHGLWLPRHIPNELRSADGRRVIPPEFLEQRDDLLVPNKAWTAVQLARWQRMRGALVSLDCARRGHLP